MTALALGLAAAALWGGSGFIGGLAARQVGALLVAAGTQLAGLIVIALAIAVVQPGRPPVADLLPALVGGLAGALGLVCLFRALALGQMGTAAPIAATGVAIPITASLVIGERPTSLQAVGIGLAVAGVVLVAREARAGQAAPGAAPQGILYALLAALSFGVFYLGLNFSGDDDVLWTVAAARGSSVLFLLLWLYLVLRQGGRRPSGERAGAKIAASGLLDVAGNTAFTLGSSRGALALVAVPAALYPLVTLVCARVVLRERLTRGQQAGAALALVGIGLMSVPG